MKTKIMPIVITLLFATGFSSVHGDENEKLEFAGYLEETLGHFWAIEKNLDDHNAELALVHATHPIAELYLLMKPELKEANPEFDARVQQTLMDLGKKTGSEVTREDAQAAINDAKEIIKEARMLVVGEELSKDPIFNAQLMVGLLKTAIGEYEEGVKNGQIVMMAEFQDGSAFVWRSQQIFDEIKNDLPEHNAEEIGVLYNDLWQAYAGRADPSKIATLTNGIIHELDEITGEESDKELGTYFENIENLLGETKEKYAKGMIDEAQSLATKAYLDNYEFLEAPIAKHDKSLMTEIEVLMREDLRSMIKSGVPSDKINLQVDMILRKLEKARELVLSSMGHEVKESDKAHGDEYVMAPLKQVKSGIDLKNVKCASGKELVIKNSSGSPACVKPMTAEKLVQNGWGKRLK
jgi:hypothetical protein